MDIAEVIASPCSPWQNPYAERLIGSLRRECLDHLIVFNETHLRRTLAPYIAYYHQARTHLSLAKDAPTPRRVQAPAEGRGCRLPGSRWVAPPVRTARRLNLPARPHTSGSVDALSASPALDPLHRQELAIIAPPAPNTGSNNRRRPRGQFLARTPMANRFVSDKGEQRRRGCGQCAPERTSAVAAALRRAAEGRAREPCASFRLIATAAKTVTAALIDRSAAPGVRKLDPWSYAASR